MDRGLLEEEEEEIERDEGECRATITALLFTSPKKLKEQVDWSGLPEFCKIYGPRVPSAILVKTKCFR